EHDRFLLLELFDTGRDRKVRRDEALVAQQQLSRRIIRQLAHEVKNPLGGLRGAPKIEELNLHRITEHVAQLIEAEKPAGVELVRDYDPSLPPLQADRNQLIQAFLNIA